MLFNSILFFLRNVLFNFLFFQLFDWNSSEFPGKTYQPYPYYFNSLPTILQIIEQNIFHPYSMIELSPSKNNIVKIAILGDGASGKTSLIRARKQEEFTEDSSITIGVDVQCLPFEYKQIQQKNATFLAVDLGGQKRFHFIHDSFLPGIKMAMIMYDLSRYTTFHNIPKWYQLVQKENSDIPVCVIGSKLDLVSEERRALYQEEFQAMKCQLPSHENIFGHFFISSKTRQGINHLFMSCEKIMKLYMEN